MYGLVGWTLELYPKYQRVKPEICTSGFSPKQNRVSLTVLFCRLLDCDVFRYKVEDQQNWSPNPTNSVYYQQSTNWKLVEALTQEHMLREKEAPFEDKA